MSRNICKFQELFTTFAHKKELHRTNVFKNKAIHFNVELLIVYTL